MKKILEIKKRFKRNDKERFLDIIGQHLSELGYEFELKHFGKIVKSINLETKNNNPDYIFIAHYDTGTIMPFWLNWLMRLFGINRQILFILLFVFLAHLISLIFKDFVYPIQNIFEGLILLSLLPAFIPNKRNLDDNTSGVISLLHLAEKFKQNGISNIKLIFVDNEELGQLGSNAHCKYLVENGLIKSHCKVYSIDCIGGKGEIPLIIRNSKSSYIDSLQNELTNAFGNCRTVNMKLPVSDNYSFRKFGALNLSFVSKSIVKGGFYIENIHSSKDDFINLRRIDKVCELITNMVKTSGN